jgi:hypothetical protein
MSRIRSLAFKPPGDSPRILGDSEVIQLRIVRISIQKSASVYRR